jgi:hypothetical protein
MTLMILKQSSLKIALFLIFFFSFLHACNNFIFLMSMFDVCKHVSNAVNSILLVQLPTVKAALHQGNNWQHVACNIF